MRTIRTWNILHTGDEVIGYSNGEAAIRRCNGTVEIWKINANGSLPDLPALVIGYADPMDSYEKPIDEDESEEEYGEGKNSSGSVQIIDF